MGAVRFSLGRPTVADDIDAVDERLEAVRATVPQAGLA
jgi:cysteine sulfinate desulfinase/cysteine desulfurase-like protein